MLPTPILFLALCLGAGVSASSFSTTTTSSSGVREQPDQLRLVDGGPLWTDHATTTEKSKLQTRALNFYTTDRTRTNLNNPIEDDDDEDDTFQPGALKEFLDSYANKFKKQDPEQSPSSDEEEDDAATPGGGEKSKSWNVLNVQKHHRPLDDKNGWVSLEPVPWSVSKISKWQSHYNKRPYDDRYGEPFERPSYSPYKRPAEPYHLNRFSDRIGIRDDNDVFYVKRPQKPATHFTKYNSQKLEVHGVDYDAAGHLTQRPLGGHRHDDDCRHGGVGGGGGGGGGDIITDGMAPNFPSSHEFGRRRGTEMHPDTHPFNGQGEWVLLSTTKGYKFNPAAGRQRSLKVDPESIGAHRSVRLTVLPPLKNSKVNMTTSHGGMLQVESTFQTVEQAHREYQRRQTNKRQKQKKKKRPQKAKPTKQVVQAAKPSVGGGGKRRPSGGASGSYSSNQYGFVRPTKQLAVTSTRRQGAAADSSAVLAAVGAGMIPATMAMLVPIALNGRRRRRDLDAATVSSRFVDSRLISRM